MWARMSDYIDRWGPVEAFRRRREARVIHAKPTYDPYPEQKYDPEVKVYIEARDVRGRLLREYVYLEGYSLHQLNFKRGARRGGQLVGEWVWDSLIEAMVRLSARLSEERELKERSDVRK